MSALRTMLSDMKNNRCYVPEECLADYDIQVEELQTYINEHRYDKS